MNIISFDYTKADGKVSKRVISPIVVPNKMYEGTDISELEAEDQVMYCQELGKLQDAYKAQIMALQEKFDLNNRYRRFDPVKMTSVVQEAVWY